MFVTVDNPSNATDWAMAEMRQGNCLHPSTYSMSRLPIPLSSVTSFPRGECRTCLKSYQIMRFESVVLVVLFGPRQKFQIRTESSCGDLALTIQAVRIPSILSRHRKLALLTGELRTVP
ncbi:hypothetical protein V6N12_048272 [Hibiscus sabdariffa]|uniref:Uncharacterized protein n=1 Tax=Hibiscus sabdariffa TaxID=183260 RepID=A0ABR2EIB5_9ROSI